MHLNEISPALTNALERVSLTYKIRLKCIYDFKSLGIWGRKLKNCFIEHIQWDIDTWLNELNQCHIGIVPGIVYPGLFRQNLAKLITMNKGFPEDYLIRFKKTSNAGRCFVFHQLKIPIVAELVPSHFHLLGDPDNGFLAYSEEGWYHSLSKLCNSGSLRSFIAEHAYNEFNRQYNPLAWARRFANELENLVSLKRR